MSDTESKAAELAIEMFSGGVQICKSKEEVSLYAQAICALSAKMIHGLEGKKFKKGFLGEAIKSNDTITLQSIN